MNKPGPKKGSKHQKLASVVKNDVQSWPFVCDNCGGNFFVAIQTFQGKSWQKCCSTECRIQKKIKGHPPFKICEVCKTEKEKAEFIRPDRRLPSSQCAACRLEINKSCHSRAPRVRAANRYGMRDADYESMLENQNNCCASCGDEFTARSGRVNGPVIDHCHKTGFVRGILCSPCNRGMGQFFDDPKRLVAAAKYLELDRPKIFKERKGKYT